MLQRPQHSAFTVAAIALSTAVFAQTTSTSAEAPQSATGLRQRVLHARSLLEDNRPGEAELVLRQALASVATDQPKALAHLHYQLALVAERQGKLCQAVWSIDTAANLHAHDFLLAEQRRLRLVSTTQLMTNVDLEVCFNRGVDYETSGIDLYIGFDLANDKMNASGERQAHELGLVLTREPHSKAVINIIGHTDLRGTDEYNDALSLRRANVVATYLTNTFAVARERIRVSGKGRHQPKSAGKTEEDHTINRRVEIELISREGEK